MAFMAMFLVTIFVVVVIVGLFIMLIGIILDIIWGVMDHKQKKVHVVHKIFAILLTVLGALVALGPIAIVGAASLSDKLAKKAELADLADEDIVHMEDCQDIYEDGLDFHGEHYIQYDELHPQPSHDRFSMTKVGAIIGGDGSQRIISRVDNLLGLDLLRVEYSSGLFIKSEDIDGLLEYYETEAPLYCEVSRYGYEDVTIDDIDSAYFREIRDYIVQSGHPFYNDSDERGNIHGYIIFYSTDDMHADDIDFDVNDNGLVVTVGSKCAVLEGEYKDYIMNLIEQADVEREED
ncbi:MAG: hypothetical protein J6Z43_08295 [Clostridiales bacterium]|nr:hypothetical protein [Clostridiales bacterium]